MKLRRGMFAALFTVLMLAATGHAVSPDQPYMRAARTELQQARAQLQRSTHNKAGHRVKAIEYINAALSEVNLGINYDRRHNHRQSSVSEMYGFVTSPDQPHMQKALDLLRQARSDLDKATADKGGHRVKAIDYVNQAIDEVKKGIDAGE